MRTGTPFFQPRSNIVWMCFAALYLASGALAYARGNRNNPEILAVAFFPPILLFFLFATCLSKGIGFSPDSYTFYDIAVHMFHKFGQVSTVRQYVIPTSDMNIAFPYLFPFFIAVVDKLTGFGMYSGVVVGAPIAVLTLFFMMRGSKRLCGSAIPGMLAILALFSTADYVGELRAARAVPLAILCVVLLFNVLAHLRCYTNRDLFLAGLFAGAGMVSRFDFMAVAGLTGVALLIMLYWKKTFPKIFLYALGLLVFTLPWILYSIINFHLLWASDNGNTLILTKTMGPLRFWLPGETIPTLFTNFAAWMTKVRGSFKTISTEIYKILVQPQNLLLFGFAVFTYIQASVTKIAQQREKREINLRWLIFGAGVVYIIKTAGIIMVGFPDLRYHIEAITIFFLLLLCAAYFRYGNIKHWLVFTAVAAVVVLAVQLPPVMSDGLSPKLYTQIVTDSTIFTRDATKTWASKVLKDSGKSNFEDVKIFFLDGDPYRIGVQTGLHCYAFPQHNPTDKRVIYLAQNLIKPDYVYVANKDKSSQWLTDLKSIYKLTQIIDAYTYRVDPK